MSLRIGVREAWSRSPCTWNNAYVRHIPMKLGEEGEPLHPLPLYMKCSAGGEMLQGCNISLSGVQNLYTAAPSGDNYVTHEAGDKSAHESHGKSDRSLNPHTPLRVTGCLCAKTCTRTLPSLTSLHPPTEKKNSSHKTVSKPVALVNRSCLRWCWYVSREPWGPIHSAYSRSLPITFPNHISI